MSSVCVSYFHSNVTAFLPIPGLKISWCMVYLVFISFIMFMFGPYVNIFSLSMYYFPSRVYFMLLNH